LAQILNMVAQIVDLLLLLVKLGMRLLQVLTLLRKLGLHQSTTLRCHVCDGWDLQESIRAQCCGNHRGCVGQAGLLTHIKGVWLVNKDSGRDLPVPTQDEGVRQFLNDQEPPAEHGGKSAQFEAHFSTISCSDTVATERLQQHFANRSQVYIQYRTGLPTYEAYSTGSLIHKARPGV
jgi:hypothetical protein